MRSEYLSFPGFGRDVAGHMDAARDYLIAQGFGGGELEDARTAIAERRLDHISFDAMGVRYCDFCFTQIMGGEYELLKDGRERCSRCSRSVLSTHEQFVDTFQQVRLNMEIAFNITINVPMLVKMVSAREISRGTGEVFTPTGGVDPRVLGFATKTRQGHELWIENGAPRLAAVTTMAHELTHVWQHSHWDEKQIVERYGKRNRLPVYEGMATWAQIQYLIFVRDFDYALRQHEYALQRDDEYGDGYRVFLERYPLNLDGDIDDDSPFHSPFPL